LSNQLQQLLLRTLSAHPLQSLLMAGCLVVMVQLHQQELRQGFKLALLKCSLTQVLHKVDKSKMPLPRLKS
jgi:hypothetical protein